MADFSTQTAVKVICSKCNTETTVPFTPTPGRPIYCRDCFAQRPARSPARSDQRGGPRGGAGGAMSRPPNSNPRKRMMAQGRKGHFVHDMREVFESTETLDENQRRMFIEMVFSRGTRMSTEAAVEFIEEKVVDTTLPKEVAIRLCRLVEKYSFYR